MENNGNHTGRNDSIEATVMSDVECHRVTWLEIGAGHGQKTTPRRRLFVLLQPFWLTGPSLSLSPTMPNAPLVEQPTDPMRLTREVTTEEETSSGDSSGESFASPRRSTASARSTEDPAADEEQRAAALEQRNRVLTAENEQLLAEQAALRDQLERLRRMSSKRKHG